jgi:ATP synthase protein I
MGVSVKNQRGLQGAQRLLMCQLSMTVLLAAIALLYSSIAAISAILGGLVSIVPTAYFATKLFRHHGAQAARQIVSSFYKGEALKIILTIALFGLVFKFFNIIPLIFFAVYIMVQMVFWFAPLIFR